MSIFNLALTSTFPKLEIGWKFGLYYAPHKEEIRMDSTHRYGYYRSLYLPLSPGKCDPVFG